MSSSTFNSLRKIFGRKAATGTTSLAIQRSGQGKLQVASCKLQIANCFVFTCKHLLLISVLSAMMQMRSPIWMLSIFQIVCWALMSDDRQASIAVGNSCDGCMRAHHPPTHRPTAPGQGLLLLYNPNLYGLLVQIFPVRHAISVYRYRI